MSIEFPHLDHFKGLGLTYDDVVLIPKLNSLGSRKNVTIAQVDRSGLLSLEVPIISANMDTITGHAMANFMESRGAMGAIHRLMNIEKNVEEFSKSVKKSFVSIGCLEKGLRRAEALYEVGARYINLDIAHGHSSDMAVTLKELRTRFPDACIMAGNVATYDGAKFLHDNGAHIVKVGIGGGGVCSTRVKTGFGVPNISAIAECSKVNCSIVADGGLRSPGDIVKALAFGADFVMIGSLLAGTGPTPGDVRETETGKKRKVFRGIDSYATQMDWFGEVPPWKTPEGVSIEVDADQNENAILDDLIGGLRSGLTYCGVSSIPELQKEFQYRVVTGHSVLEGTPHRS